jgi:hypothetical protein
MRQKRKNRYAEGSRGRLVAILAPLAVALALGGCGSEHSTYNIPPGAFQYISPGQLDALVKMGMKINEGLAPPDIEGTYYADSMTRIGGNIPNDTAKTFANMSLDLSGQGSDNTIVVSYIQGPESGDGLGAFVSGTGGDFTIFTQITGTISGINFQDAMLFSGTIATDGIHDFVYALLLTKKDPDPTDLAINVNQARVIDENDKLVVRTTSFP